MNIEAFFAAPWHVQLHAASALGALGLGAVQLIAPKGTLPHRQLGYVWVFLMIMTATTAIFIRSTGGFSWIHVFVPLTFIFIALLIFEARKGLVAQHRNTVLGTYLGALMIPGVLSFFPGRLMHTVTFGG
ncbi:MAG: putative membrane protein [Oceanicaulis sp. HLUCCA04]|nr:MAG: putative membrane protein [Oceanicaulis sp. HLUCCA04]